MMKSCKTRQLWKIMEPEINPSSHKCVLLWWRALNLSWGRVEGGSLAPFLASCRLVGTHGTQQAETRSPQGPPRGILERAAIHLERNRRWRLAPPSLDSRSKQDFVLANVFWKSKPQSIYKWSISHISRETDWTSFCRRLQHSILEERDWHGW